MIENSNEDQVGLRAKDLFLSGVNCAEAVSLSVVERLGSGRELPPGIASGFGGGIGRCGLVCGAISGAVIAAGWHLGKESGVIDKDKLYEILSSLVRAFQSRFGSANCRELIGFNLADPEEHLEALKSGTFTEKCASFVEFCASETVGLLEQRRT